MRTIEVCVGSSCFLKGSYQVLETLLALVRRHGLDAQVSVAGAFCMENCRQGVSVKVDDTVYSIGDTKAAEQLFTDRILGQDQELA